MSFIPVLLAAAVTATVFISVQAFSLTIEECIRQSLIESPDIEAAAARIEAARAMTGKAQAAYYPFVSFSTGYMRTDNPPQAFMMSLNQRSLDMRAEDFDPNNPDDSDNIRTSVGFRYELYNFGRRRLDYDMAGSGSKAACHQLSSVQNELIYQIIASFYGVLQAQAFVQVQEESVGSLEESLRVARERYQAGSAVKTDVLNLEVKLAQALEDLILAQNNVLLAVASLNTAIGKDLVSGPSDLVHPMSRDLPALPPEEVTMVENRPELQASRTMTEIKSMALKKARREYAPTINAFGSYDFDGETLTDTEDSYLVGANLQWDLFTGFYRRSSVAEARSNLAAAEAEKRMIRNRLRLDLKQAYLKAVDAQQRMEVTRKSLESAEESLRITMERYKGMAADITELLTAQVGLTVTRTRGVSAYFEYLTALSNLERAKGLLAQRYAPCEGQ